MRFFFFFAFLLLGTSASDALPPSQLDEYLKVLEFEFKSREAKLGRGAVIVTHKDKIIYKSIFGHKKDGKGSINEDTLFSLASASKPISATMLAHLEKHDKISFNDSVGSYVPGMDEKILLKHAISHSSGYNDTFGNRAVEGPQTRAEIKKLFLQKKPENPPGNHYSYSNVIFSLLEDLVTDRTQLSFHQNMRNFLSQIGISNEEVCQVNQFDTMAFPHRKKGRKLAARKVPEAYAGKVCSAAGIFLSINHLAKFLSLMTGQYPQVLAKEELQKLFVPQVEVKDIFYKWQEVWPFPVKELKSYYGLGWRTLEWNKDPGHKLVFHSGHLNGVSTFVGILPERDLGIAVLSNQDTVFSEGFGFDFWKYSLNLESAG